MQIHEIPRNYKGEGRILFVFSTKALLYTGIGVMVGSIFYLILNALMLGGLAVWPIIIFGGLGFCIGTFKMPDSKKFSITEKTGGEAIDDVIKRWIKFKLRKNKIYVYTKEEGKDE